MSFTGKIGKEITRAIRTEFIAAFGTFLTIFLAMMMPAIIWLISKNLLLTESELKQGLTIDAYLLPDATQPQIDSLAGELSSFNFVDKIKFVSSQEALFQLREMFGSEMIEGLDENPLPPLFKLSLKPELFFFEKAQFQRIIDTTLVGIAAIPGVDDVLFGGEILEKLNRSIKLIKTAGLIISILVLIASIFIVANTVRIAISDRKVTIEMMQLVGATRIYIMAPFVAIGGLLGLLGSGLALTTLFFAVNYLSGNVIKIAFFNFSETLLFLVFGIVVGLIGSLITLPRYLK